MPETVTVREDLQIIQVDSSGKVTSEDLKKSIDAVARFHEEREFNRVFVDAAKVTSLPATLPSFQVGARLAKAMVSLRVAVLGTPELVDDMSFIETVARNRGAAIRVFRAREAALKWLMQEPDNQPHRVR